MTPSFAMATTNGRSSAEPSRKTITVYAKNSDTIQDLKDKLYDRGGIPPEHTIILYSGAQLQNVQSVGGVGLQPGNVLATTARLRGGALSQEDIRQALQAWRRGCKRCRRHSSTSSQRWLTLRRDSEEAAE